MCLALLAQVWQGSGYGIDLNGRRYTPMVFADNVWLPDHNPENLSKMMHSLTSVLEHNGLHWKPESLCHMASTSAQPKDLRLASAQGELIVKGVTGMEVLGVWVDRDGATKPSYEHRAAKAEKKLSGPISMFC